ncbi:hypothetical protein J27TS7_38390 [Paenibacillus dendritiformis]|nr:hypothetical protein [Paenibacillus dendritiformis]NRF99534.1 hypothetical protein [Paenibacillus dendritiformis]GIO74325.1 hypothetical protein J27TS7_38390 [Paenibacillus dendritiformis]
MTMRGTIRWNFIVGIVGFVITLLLSWSGNLWTTSLIRAAIAFAAWFALGFAIRFAAGVLGEPGAQAASPAPNGEDKGNLVDMTTPDESDMLHEMLRTMSNEEKPTEREDDDGTAFQPLNPPKLVTKEPLPDAGQLAQAVRHLTQK